MSINSFNSLLDKAISVANVAGKKTEEMVEASKLKIQEVSVNADLANCYEKIGSLVYSSKKFGADNEQEIAQLIAQADELLEQLAQLQAKREEIRKVRVPILVVGGDNDLQVPPDNAEALAKAQPRARKAIIAGMTHPLKKCTGRMRIDQTGAYGDSTLPIDPDLVAVVTQFIRGL